MHEDWVKRCKATVGEMVKWWEDIDEIGLMASDNQIDGGHGRVITGSALAVSTLKFKQRSVPAVRDFPPRCRRVTTSNYGMTRQIAIDHSSEGK
ncbi:hypothetical protein J1N35_040834 [Gossypium stocksii]|uniref:Uncharacterized protein n=1 Tax=Gossypium stocksii TaxID=47602 RepID=A0A9D3UEL0_9ROSI|nr:hypothetical protein J1N35_040834 [Gossypium stocksii]